MKHSFFALLAFQLMACGSDPVTDDRCDDGEGCDGGFICAPTGVCEPAPDADSGADAGADAGRTDTGAPPDTGVPDGGVVPIGGNVELVSAEMVAPRSVRLVFSGAVNGSNVGFAVFGTRSTGFDAVTGFGTSTLMGSIDQDVVYGEIVTVSYNEGPGDLVNVRWFRKEFVENELAFVGGVDGAGRELYVTADATGTGDGTASAPYRPSQLTSATVRAGDRINIEAGSYDGSLPVPLSGTPGNPIVYEGYRDAPGDVRYRADYPTAWEPLTSAGMPLFEGGNRGAGIFCQLVDGNHDLVFRNLQARNYRWGVAAGGDLAPHDLYFDNLALENFGTDTNGGGAVLLRQNTEVGMAGGPTNRAIHVINSYALNGSQQNFWVDGDESYLFRNRSYSNESRDHDWDTDYMFVAYFGRGMVWRQLHLEKGPSPGHAGHGLTLKAISSTLPIERALIDDCDVVNVNGAIEFRHSAVRNNLARNIRMDGNGGGVRSSAVVFRDGASFNTVDGCLAFDLQDNTNGAVTFLDTREDGGYGQLMEQNVVRNSVFYNTRSAAIRLGTSDENLVLLRDNHFVNNTFVGAAFMFRISAATDNAGLAMTNNIFQDIPTRVRGGETVEAMETYNDYFDYWGPAGVAPDGAGNLAVDPSFEDLAAEDFRLAADSPLMDAGLDVRAVRYDYLGIERNEGMYSMGAYERD